ncbi:MAG: M48 family metalloprotease [Syntrophales bacterium]|nr:M48 family metalloprotease [Syntrophales bacterium]
MKTFPLRTLILSISLAGLIACNAAERMTAAATDAAERTGLITRTHGDSIRAGMAAVSKSLEEFTPEQEYYIGRSVGAVILSNHSVLKDQGVQSYVTLLGHTIAAASDMPELFSGYHFLVLDSDDINAFATPGGHVFITRGLIRCCRNEDALAAVLAHEIGHIQLRHGMQAIEKARTTEALTIIAREGLKTLGPGETAQLTGIFGNVISDITSTMINSGYSRSFEYQADAAALSILRRAGYSPEALVGMLEIMENYIEPGRADFARTHPSPRSRISELKKNSALLESLDIPRVRTDRFIRHAGHLL